MVQSPCTSPAAGRQGLCLSVSGICKYAGFGGTERTYPTAPAAGRQGLCLSFSGAPPVVKDYACPFPGPRFVGRRSPCSRTRKPRSSGSRTSGSQQAGTSPTSSKSFSAHDLWCNRPVRLPRPVVKDYACPFPDYAGFGGTERTYPTAPAAGRQGLCLSFSGAR